VAKAVEKADFLRTIFSRGLETTRPSCMVIVRPQCERSVESHLCALNAQKWGTPSQEQCI
jgi:hypothetical protein